jgi:5-methylcytosine-specific restriction endonuclease McrA
VANVKPSRCDAEVVQRVSATWTGPVARWSRWGQARTDEEEAAWQRVRQVVLRRDNWTCQECGEQVPRSELDVHHLLPRHAGGRDDASNCTTLCDGCHANHHPGLQVSLGRRAMERWALRLARWLDRAHELPSETAALQEGLRLFGIERMQDHPVAPAEGPTLTQSETVL